MEINTEYLEYTLKEIDELFPILNKFSASECDIKFRLTNIELVIRIRFPTDFPYSAPTFISCLRVEHERIDILNTINYPEYYNWDPNENVAMILKKIHEEFLSSPPILSNKNPYPNFLELINAYGPITDDNDVLEVVRTTKEFKNLLAKRDELLEENEKRANENIKAKEEYNQIYDENIEIVQKLGSIKEKVHDVKKELAKVNEKYRVESVIQAIKTQESEYSVQANEIFKNFGKKTMNCEEFIENYHQIIKEMKKLQFLRESLI